MPTDSLKAFYERLGRLIEADPESAGLPLVTVGAGGLVKVAAHQAFVKVHGPYGEVLGVQLSLEAANA